jgi:hypothetical protein
MRRLALLLPLLAGCDSPTAPALPTGAERFTPPAVYREWWDLAQACSGLSGDLSRVAWYRVEGVSEVPLGDGTMVNGYWHPVGNRIVLAADAQLDGQLVRHEMLHALLGRDDHPREAFIGRCAGTVVCIERCITEAGPSTAPDPAARVVAPDALQIGVELSSPAPRASVNEGHFRMVVTARNGAPTPVIVRLPPSGDAGPPVSFSYEIVGAESISSYDMRADVPEAARFAPFETKRFIFDFQIGATTNRYTLPPGTYEFRGSYGERWAPNAPTATLSP